MNIRVKGKQVLSGEIFPSGSKNSAVALIPATLLFDKKVILKNIPDITDIDKIVRIMQALGSKINWDKEKKEIEVDNSNLTFRNLGRKEIGDMRGTSLLWGPLLARFGKVVFEELPGGCTLGARPLSPQYEAFKDLGVEVKPSNYGVTMNAQKAKAQELWLRETSPTSTENIIMLATGLKGKTKIIGAASEPQVQDLCHFLMKSGARINGIGSNVLEIEGGKLLKPKKYEIFSDHYEIATFLAFGACTGGEIKVHKALPRLMVNILDIFERLGIIIEYENETAYLKSGQKVKISNGSSKSITIKAQPWPALPVDLLPIFIPIVLSAKEGQVIFHNWMYEAGLFWTSELVKMGANVIMADPHRVIVTAGCKLRGATLEAPYIIRAVVSMIMTAMIAEGETKILNADTIHRGHPNFVQNLRKLGAKVEEIEQTSRKFT